MKNSIHLKSIFTLLLFLFIASQISFGKKSFSSVKLHQIHSTIILTEVMFDPIGSEYYDEFVEIYSLSSTDSVDLTGWQIGDGEGFDQIVDAGFGLKLAPGQFGLILDSGYFDHSTSFDSLIPPEALILTIDGASFGQRGWSNSSDKMVVLLDSSGTTLEQYTYSIGNQQGFSDEKINLSKDNSQTNWKDSYQLNGTPGFYNSVSPRQNDLSLELVYSSNNHPHVNETWQIKIQIKNVGTSPADQFQLVGFYYEPPDSVLICDYSFTTALQSNDELIQLISLETNTPGEKIYRFFLLWQPDENQNNNIVSYSENIPFSSGEVVINEIMYYPQSNFPEWLEIYNSSNYPINFEKWRLSTELYFEGAELISKENLSLGQNEYFVFSGDSVFCEMQGDRWIYMKQCPRLRDSGDDLFLFDPFGTLIDSVSYETTWGKKRGFSLERVWYERSGQDSTNWKLAQKIGGTPAMFNSRSPLEADILISNLFADPNPLPYLSDTNISFNIKNNGRTKITDIELQIFFDINLDSIPQPEELLFPTQQLATSLGVEDSVSKNYQLSNLNSGYSNLSVLIISKRDQNLANNFQTMELKVGYPPSSVIINEIMYYPFSDEPEWIEIFNRSNFEINIRDWYLYESFSEKFYPITSENILINPNSYVVISADSNIGIATYSELLVPEKFPSLNNKEENIKLVDFSNTTIDSVHYYDSWGGDIGISLERINPNLASDDSGNWASSASSFGKTPGEQNSIFVESLPSDATISISPNPFSPDGDGYEDFTMIQYDLPMKTAYVSVQVFDLLGRQVCDLLNTTPSGSHREIIWNGKKNNGESLRIGVYIIFLEALNAQKGLLKQVKTPIVIAGKL